MSLESNVSDLATKAGLELKKTRNLVNGNAEDLAALQTTAKGNLVAAINEVKSSVSGAAGINDATTSTSSTWSSSKVSEELEGKAAASHTHPTSQVTGLDAALAGKAPTSHTHTAAQVTGLAAALINDTTAAAGTAYSSQKVDAQIAAAKSQILGDAPSEALDTLRELGDALDSNESAVSAITTALGKRVAVDSAQTFTGPEQTQARTNIGAVSTAALTALSDSIGSTSTNFVTAFETALA